VDYRDFTLYLTKKSEWKQIVDRFEHYNAPISLKLKKKFFTKDNDILEHLTRLTNLEHFEIASLSDGDFEDWYKLTAMTALKLMPDFHMPLDMWKKLTQLEAFNFFNSSNKISLPEITDAVTNLTNLHELCFRANEDANLQFITAAHSKLTRLIVEFGTATQWNNADLQRLSNLKDLTLHNMDTLPEEDMPVLSLKYLTALEELRTNFQIADINSTRLRRIDLSSMSPSKKALFPFLYNVEDIIQIPVEENMEYLTSLTRLHSIRLTRQNNMADGHKYSILGNIMSSRLTYMHFYQLGDSVDFGYLSKLGSIQHLRLFDTYCGENITALTNLEQFGFILRNEMVDNSALLSCLPKLTKLRRLWYYPELKHTITVDLSPLTNLHSLILSLEATFTGLDELTNLTDLELNGSDLEAYKFPFLAKMTNLRQLSVYVDDCDTLQYVTALTNLHTLSVNRCHNDDEVQALASLCLSSLSVTNTAGSVNCLHLTRMTTLQTLSWELSVDEAVMIKRALPDLLSFSHRVKN
jgi:hypothetical protein